VAAHFDETAGKAAEHKTVQAVSTGKPNEFLIEMSSASYDVVAGCRALGGLRDESAAVSINDPVTTAGLGAVARGLPLFTSVRPP